MSLLLDALKKAELAKQAIKPEAASSQPLDFAPDMPEPQPVVTRESLPDISPNLEIFSPEPAPKEKPAQRGGVNEPAVSPLDLDSVQPLSGLSEPASSDVVDRLLSQRDFRPDAAQAEPERAAARQVFEAKEMEYNPRRPFYITIGVLVVCAAGYAGYLWWQLQPKYISSPAALKEAATSGAGAPATAAVRAAPPQAAAEAPIPASPTTTIQATAPAPGQPQAAQQAAAGQPPSPAQSATAQAPTAGPQSGAVRGNTAQATAGPRNLVAVPGPAVTNAQQAAARPAIRDAAPGAAGSGESSTNRRGTRTPIVVTPPTQTVDPQIEQAYANFQRGEYGPARDLYQRVLQRDSANRDALLGLAAIDVRSRDFDMAESRYLRLLEADPRDPYAQAGMMALRGRVDPVQSESRIKNLIAVQPEIAHLHFALGNQYAAQRRWPEAQAAFFRAFTLDAENPDFAFNLAVSLDQLRQKKPALDYYQRALSLASAHNASFDKTQVSTRIAELSR